MSQESIHKIIENEIGSSRYEGKENSNIVCQQFNQTKQETGKKEFQEGWPVEEYIKQPQA